MSDRKAEPDYAEVKELVRICPQLGYLARKVGIDQRLLSLIEKAESETQ